MSRGIPTADGGSVALEAVLVVPVLMVVLLVVVQFVLWAHAAQVVQLAASEGDRVARAQGGSASGAMAAAQGVLGTDGSSVVGPAVGIESVGGGEVQVTVGGRAESIVPWLTLPVHAAAAGPLQIYRVSG